MGRVLTFLMMLYHFVEDSGLHEVQITIQTAFPGTPLFKRLEDENRIIERNAWEKRTLFDINYIPSMMTTDELSDGFKRLGVNLYNDEFTAQRRRHYKEILSEIVKTRRGPDSIKLISSPKVRYHEAN